jgi:hypothetical protein
MGRFALRFTLDRTCSRWWKFPLVGFPFKIADHAEVLASASLSVVTVTDDGKKIKRLSHGFLGGKTWL